MNMFSNPAETEKKKILARHLGHKHEPWTIKDWLQAILIILGLPFIIFGWVIRFWWDFARGPRPKRTVLHWLLLLTIMAIVLVAYVALTAIIVRRVFRF